MYSSNTHSNHSNHRRVWQIHKKATVNNKCLTKKNKAKYIKQTNSIKHQFNSKWKPYKTAFKTSNLNSLFVLFFVFSFPFFKLIYYNRWNRYTYRYIVLFLNFRKTDIQNINTLYLLSNAISLDFFFSTTLPVCDCFFNNNNNKILHQRRRMWLCITCSY